MSETILGIDLGTTNSEVAVLRDGRPFVIPGPDGNPILPSVVGLAADGQLLVGQAARNQLLLAPERTIKSVKRRMGEEVELQLAGQTFRPQEISAMILRALKDRAEAFLGRSVAKAVITVPAYFNDSQRQATREAGRLAGLEVVRIINEPTAAALTYQPRQTASERILVYDLGGGTFDVSILQCEGGVYEVLASHGDTRLGGDDFDALLVNLVAEDFLGLHDVDLRHDARARQRLLLAVENAKKKLSDHPFALIEEEFIAQRNGVPLHLRYELDRQELEQLIRPLLDKTLHCLQQALADARLVPAQLTRVVLVGGSTRIPLIARLLEERLGQTPHREIHPELCVAMGAAIQGGIVAGQPVGSVLVDITPHTLGIKCLDVPQSHLERPSEFRFAPIIRRNTPLPASQSEVFCTVYDNQPTVEIDVYQGEHADVRRNHRVGRFMIEGLSPAPAGNPLIVQLDLTLDGTLKVSAREKATGLVRQITIDNALARFAVEERDAAQQRLNRLWELSANDLAEMTEPPASPPVPSNGPHLAVAQALLEKAARIREKALPEDQCELDRLVEEIRHAIREERWDNLSLLCAQLSDVLFYLEDA